jgi:hypothetical protein
MTTMMRTLLVAAMLGATLYTHAAILRVNNSGLAAPYNNIQAAHDAAATGDTIHLEASQTNYGLPVLSKQLVILGPGYLLGENAQTQASLPTATVTSLNFGVGSDGTVVSGITFNSFTIISRNNTRVERCRFLANVSIYTGFVPTFSGVQLVGCLIEGDLQIGGAGSSIQNLTAANNIILGTVSNGAPSSGVFRNNVVSNASATPAFTANDLVVQNNIFDCEVDPGNNVFAHNLFRTAPVEPEDGNVLNVVMNTVFTGGTGDSQWQLAPGSPALGAADDNGDCGAFAGSGSYRLSGIPAIPNIFGLNAPNTIGQGMPLQVTMSARTND